MLRLRPVIATTFALLLGCTAEPETAPDGSGPADEAEAARSKIAVNCTPTSTLEPGSKAKIHGAAQEVFDRLRAGDIDAIWSALHPQAQRADQREAFTQALDNMHRRLRGSSAKPTVEHAFFVDVQGGVTDLARIACGAKDDPQALTLFANAGNEDLAVVTLTTPGEPFGLATTVQLRRTRAGWRVLGVNVGLASYRGRDATDYETLADGYVGQQRAVEAYLALGIAEQLAGRGGSMKTTRLLTISDKLSAVGRSREYQQHLGAWELGGVQYNVTGFSIAATQSDLSAVVKYVSPGGLIKEILDSEADQLLGYVKMQYPELAKQFDALVLEAYAQESDSEEQVDAYRVARYFEPRAAARTD